MEEKVKYPHPMYDPKSGEEVVVRSKEEHDKYSEKGWVHEKPVNEVEEPRPAGEKNFKAMHSVKKSGKKMDGSDIQESVTVKPKTWSSIEGDGKIVSRLKNAGYVYGKTSNMSREDDPAWINPKTGVQVIIEPIGDFGRLKVMASSKDGGTVLRPTLVSNPSDMGKINKLFEEKKCEMSESEKQEKYQAFFKSALKRFGAESPAELDADKKKEFFSYIDKNWESEEEVKESVSIDENIEFGRDVQNRLNRVANRWLNSQLDIDLKNQIILKFPENREIFKTNYDITAFLKPKMFKKLMVEVAVSNTRDNKSWEVSYKLAADNKKWAVGYIELDKEKLDIVKQEVYI
jgi:hypothetical protein